MLRRLRVALAFTVLIVIALAAYAQTPGARSEGFAVGALVILGVQVVVLLSMAARLQKWIDARVDARMTDDTSAFGKHRLDPFAHEPMRRQIMKELHDEFEKLRTTVAVMDKHHRDEFSALSSRLTEIVKPIVEQNSEAMRIMASQMRRQPATDDEPRGRRGGGNDDRSFT